MNYLIKLTVLFFSLETSTYSLRAQTPFLKTAVTVNPNEFVRMNSLTATDTLAIGQLLYVAYGSGPFDSKKGALIVYELEESGVIKVVRELNFSDRTLNRLLKDKENLYAVGRGLSIFEISQPRSPVEIAYHKTTSGTQQYEFNSEELDKTGNFIFVDRGWDGLMCVDVSNSKDPKYVSKRNMNGSLYVGIAVYRGNTIVSFDDFDSYYSTFENGVLTSTETVKIPGWPTDVVYDDITGIAFVCSEPALGGKASLSALDIASKTVLGSVDISDEFSSPKAITYSRSLVFIEELFSDAFIAVDVSNPKTMRIVGRNQSTGFVGSRGCFRFLPELRMLAVGDGTKINLLIHDSGKPSEPPVVHIRNAAGNFILEYQGQLQSSDRPEGPYKDELVSESLYKINPSNAMKYYRARSK